MPRAWNENQTRGPRERSPWANVRFTPDGIAVAIATLEKGTSAIRSYPVAEDEPKTVVQYPQQDISDFRWSPDGKEFAVARGRTLSDVVLVRDGRK